MADAYIIDACRTPRGIGKPGKGALSSLHPQQLAATVMKAIVERTGIDSADIDDVIWSVGTQVDKQGHGLGRMSALDAGYDKRASGVTLQRACGGGATAVNLAAASIMSGMEDLVVAGGVEMMSYTATLTPDGLGVGGGNPRLRHSHPQGHQGVCADAIAAREGIGRTELDAFGVESQRRAATAIAEGRFAKSLVPVHGEDGTLLLDREEFPRPQTTAEGLAALKPAFAHFNDMPGVPDGQTFAGLIKEVYPDLDWTPVHHAGTSSGVVDGAAAVLLASDAYVAKHGLKPRARVIAFANQGDCPTMMLDAPVPAIEKVLARAGLTTDDIDLWEINEAFAVVVEKVIRDLDLDRAKVNVNGGAIALGHPIGATGAVLIGTVLDELERQGLRRGLVTMCAAGGMAPAIIIERV